MVNTIDTSIDIEISTPLTLDETDDRQINHIVKVSMNPAGFVEVSAENWVRSEHREDDEPLETIEFEASDQGLVLLAKALQFIHDWREFLRTTNNLA